MKNLLLPASCVAGSFLLVACAEDKPAPIPPAPVARETRTVHHYHQPTSRSSAPSNDPADFEPVERPATYSH